MKIINKNIYDKLCLENINEEPKMQQLDFLVVLLTQF